MVQAGQFGGDQFRGFLRTHSEAEHYRRVDLRYAHPLVDVIGHELKQGGHHLLEHPVQLPTRILDTMDLGSIQKTLANAQTLQAGQYRLGDFRFVEMLTPTRPSSVFLRPSERVS